jgi:hypothetical protein
MEDATEAALDGPSTEVVVERITGTITERYRPQSG